MNFILGDWLRGPLPVPPCGLLLLSLLLGGDPSRGDLGWARGMGTACAVASETPVV